MTQLLRGSPPIWVAKLPRPPAGCTGSIRPKHSRGGVSEVWRVLPGLDADVIDGHFFFFRRAADIAQRLGPESWINAKRRQKMDVNSSPSCTSQSLQWQTQHQHRQQVRRSANPPARFAYYRLPKTRKQQQHGARAQDRNTNFATKALKGNSTPQCQNQKHAIETNEYRTNELM
jgi:hypothetical protein